MSAFAQSRHEAGVQRWLLRAAIMLGLVGVILIAADAAERERRK
jgi:hypothetical protein